jgi:Zn-dependent metalloprotease
MFYKTALVASLIGTAAATPSVKTTVEVTDDDISEFYKDIKSADHPAQVLKSSKAHKKWVKFPEQYQAHAIAVQQGPGTRGLRTEQKVVPHADFFERHAETFGLSEKTSMKGKKSTIVKNTHTVRHSYDQYYEGVKVLTGDYSVTVGAHDGVLHAHGLSFSGMSLRQSTAEIEKIRAKAIDTDAVQAKVKAIILERSAEKFKPKIVDIKSGKNQKLKHAGHKAAAPKHLLHQPHRYGELTEEDIVFKDVNVELVIHPEWLGRGVMDSALAYNVVGSVHVKGQFLAFDACLDVGTLDSRLFIDKTNEFSVSFGDSEVNIYDSPDAETIGGLTWANRAPYDQETTGSVVGDLLVDTTMQTRNLMYSLSGGEYESWSKTNTPLDIVQITDPNFSNAFYDGDRIWFGPGFETDDVIGHEWGHGYTNTMNNLYYYEDSGSLNEAFSDIIGEAVDILNKDTPDTENKRDRDLDVCTNNNPDYGGTDSSYRWLMGEETIIGMLRDMHNPECADHPSHHRSAWYDLYWCFDENDGYGVHTNSGIMNKVFSTLADGGTQRQMQASHYTPKAPKYSKGIGLTKALNLVFDAYADLTQFSDYQDLAVAMESQCELLKTGDIYRPITDRQEVALFKKSMTDKNCRRVRIILKRAYLYDNSVSLEEDCTAFCRWTGLCS